MVEKKAINTIDELVNDLNKMNEENINKEISEVRNKHDIISLRIKKYPFFKLFYSKKLLELSEKEEYLQDQLKINETINLRFLQQVYGKS